MTKNEGKFYISLTGENSHEVDIPAGQGSFSIAPKGYGDAYVDADTPISWSAFDGMQIPADGHWPRFFYYAGNDASFAQWSQERKIESFFWAPQKDVSLDLSKAHIRRLSLDCDRFKICVRLGTDTRKAEFYGKAENFTIEDAGGLKDVSFCFREDDAKGAEPFKLPVFAALAGIERIEIDAPVCGEPFDCESLLQFSALKSVSLNGAVCNLRAFSALEGLNSIQIRYCPDLNGFPPLKSWRGLIILSRGMSSKTQARRLKRSLPRLLKRESLATPPSRSCVKRRSLRASLTSPLQTGRAKTAKPRLQNRAKSDQKSKLRARSEGGHRGARGRDK